MAPGQYRMLTVLWLLLVIAVLYAGWMVYRRSGQYGSRHRRTDRAGWGVDDTVNRDSAGIGRRNARKPDWVRQELIRFRVLSPQLGCRLIAEVFNRQFAERRVSVSKSYVAQVWHRHRSEIADLRQTLKHRVPREMRANRTWAMDLTGKAECGGPPHLILGVLDHGSRALLALRELADKRSLTILQVLIGLFRCYGIPQRIRVDNEACFVSRRMQFALRLLGITLQRIQPHCPWQNGRMERVFGTLKQYLDRVCIVSAADLHQKLIEFRCWYNHARPHQHLQGRTPAEAWDGRTKATGAPQRYSGWDGQLVGWYFPG